MRLSNRLSILAAVLLLTASLVSAKSSAAIDPTRPGSYAVETAEYKFPATLDPEVPATKPAELWARAFWPKDLSKPHPIVFLLHGNHPTCRLDGTFKDQDCSYANEGTCPAGYSVVLNHEGYNYLGKQLASLGYIAVTINANRGITCGGSNTADWGLNLARGRLVLRHIEQWNKWATEGGAPSSLGLAPNAFVGRVDITNVGLVGHSRGGEGMRAAYNLYREQKSQWPALIPHLQVRGIFELASVDGQTDRVLDANDTARNAVISMCDGDVQTHDGRMPFERMMLKNSETRKTPKSLAMVYGANHNFFNTEWKTSDSKGCATSTPSLQTTPQTGPQALVPSPNLATSGVTPTTQQSLASGLISAFFLANVGTEKSEAAAETFDPLSKLPATIAQLTRVDRDHTYTPDELFSTVVDDFDQPTGQSSSRKSNHASGVEIEHVRVDKPKHALVKWAQSGTGRYFQSNCMLANQGRNISAYTSLDFRAGRPMGQETQPPSDFSIALVDASNKLSKSVAVSKFIVLDGPNTATITDVMSLMNEKKTELYQTVRIPLELFGLTPNFKVQGVRFIFDKSKSGTINIANVRFSRNDPAAFQESLSERLPPIDVTPIEDEEEADPFQADVKNNGWTINSPNLPPAATPTPAPVVRKPISIKPGKAKLSKSRFVRNSPYLNGESGYEFAVRAEGGAFPVEATLPTLNIAGNKISVSRYPDDGQLNVLIFSLNTREYSKLPNVGEAQVQYGRISPQKVWQLPTFDKAKLAN